MRTVGKLTWHAMHGGPLWGITARPHVMIRLKRLLPRVAAHRTGTIYVTDTPEMAYDLRWITSRYPLDMTEDVAARLEDRAGVYEQRSEVVDAILAGRTTADAWVMQPAREPRPYQMVAANMASTVGRILIADDLGLGKTLEALLVLAAPDALPALVVTLTHLPAQWLRELELTWPMLRGHAVTKTTPYDLAAARGNNGQVPDVLVMGYSKLAGWADALTGQVRTVIFDEVQELRHGTLTAKGAAAAQVADAATYAIGLSATPIYNYGGEIHSILSILYRDSLGSREEFLREWGATEINGKSSVADPAALGTYLRDAGLMLRRTRKDVHRELPESLRIRQDIDSHPDALNRMSADSVAMARLILDGNADRRQRWAAAGDLDWRLRQATGIGKAPYVADFVRMLLESEQRVVLFGWHRSCYDIWLERLADLRPVLYTGSESPTQKRDAARRFTEGDARVLIMSLRAGAGLDGLQKACSVAVFGELDWSPEVHNQCVGRLARDGQDSTVVAYFLVSDQGSDPVVDEVLQLKRSQAEPVRDPDLPLFAAAQANPDRVRMLARSVLERAGYEAPPVAAS